MSATNESPAVATVRIAGKPYQLTLHPEHLRAHLDSLGHQAPLTVAWTSGINPGEYYQEENGQDVVCLNPHFVVLVRLGLFPLPWPAAFCSFPLYRKRLLQTLAHELRHAQQMAGLTPVALKDPWLSYTVLRNLGRGYIVLALVGAIAVQQLLLQEALGPALWIGGGLIALALLYIVLAYCNYHLDPLEVDARAYERSSWEHWEACVSFQGKGPAL